MSVEAAALKFKRWAVENHLLRKGREDKAPDVSHPLTMDEESNKAAKAVLRTKPISFLGVNRRDETIIVYLRVKPTRTEERRLITDVDGYKVVYKKGTPASWTGKVRAALSRPYEQKNGAYTCGSSIYLAGCLGAGTLGCLVRNERGIIFGLTNNHVSASCNHAEVGFPILAPAAIDAAANGIGLFTIGRHLECAPMIDGLPENVNYPITLMPQSSLSLTWLGSPQVRGVHTTRHPK